MPSLIQVLEASALQALEIQQPDGSMPSGHNGPYHDPETPVRNTAHWLVTFCHIYEQTQDQRLFHAANKATNYLLSAEARPQEASFFCRKNPKKDSCNGLIGQAWAIEGLICAARTLKREDAYTTAKEVFELHPFLENRAIWQRVAAEGNYLTPDRTFNHQLWFAAIGAELRDQEATDKVYQFLDQIGTNVDNYQNGVIFHNSPLGKTKLKDLNSLSNITMAIKRIVKSKRNRRSLYSKSVGYHSFNLYAFAILKKHFPKHKFWSSSKMQKMLDITKEPIFRTQLDQSDYSWPYNPPGLELAFCGEAFDLGKDYCQKWITTQVEKTYDHKTKNLMLNNSADTTTSSARIYEATRLNNDYEVNYP
ncbi:agl cluster protein AglQ [Euhalothece natronophila Z-M001]|uniref:Agl cluster protein AglQ n=1 Tax=Euhalothece natronophila Z-M001 TaxID=522448 RepID=A0A5B8NP33_9CHRO|nr:agl cluster protein AglQ [Euhalothece natronophila]QDZ40717.1 agl cluster protein AglQ [Euhalothece natronophila Z-M001]